MADGATALPDRAGLATLRGMIHALPDPAMLVAPDGVILVANPAADELFATPMTGARVRAHLRQPEAAAMIESALDPASPANATHRAQMVIGSASAEMTWQITARKPGADAGIAGIVVSLQDISDREAAEAQRRDFIANVSHELRSPLTVLAGFIETLQGAAQDDPKARAEFLGIMARETQRMSALVADLLSLSRLEGSERIRPRHQVPLSEVLQSTLAALAPRIAAAGLTLEQDMPDGLPMIAGDQDQLVQVFHNLLENALRYGASGGRISLCAKLEARHFGMEGPVIHVTVTDYGDGIDPIHIPRLTERFYRVDRARSRAQDGTGLGLSIVKHILNRHRGRLLIRSSPGAGSSFTAVLPCASCPEAPGPVAGSS